LKATRGAVGGYRLGREQNRISVYDSADPLTAYSSALAVAIVQPALARAEQTFAAALRRISLEDLVRWAERKALITSNPAEPGAAKS